MPPKWPEDDEELGEPDLVDILEDMEEYPWEYARHSPMSNSDDYSEDSFP